MKKILAFLLLTLGALSGTARADDSDSGLTVILGTDAPQDKFPNLQWRIGATVTQGLADFLFEVRVLKSLPPEKTDPDLQSQLQYDRPDQYMARLFYYIERAMDREAAKIAAEAAAQGIVVTGQIHLIPGFVPRTQPGQEVAFKDTLALVVPDLDAFLLLVQDPAVRATVSQVLAALKNTRLYVLDSEIGPQMTAIQQTFADRRASFESGSPTGDLDTALGVHHARLVFQLGDPSQAENTVQFELTGETRQIDEDLPDAVKNVQTNLALGLQASPDSLHLPAWCGFRVTFTHPISQTRNAGANDTVAITFGQLADFIGISEAKSNDLLPRIDLKLSGGFPGLHQLGQLFRPNIHARSLTYDLGTNQFDRGGSKLGSSVTPFGVSALSVNLGMQQTILNAMNGATDEVRQGLLRDLMQSETIGRLMTTASAALLNKIQGTRGQR